MKPVHAPFPYRWLSPHWLVCEQPSSEKSVFLTFDDGPVPEATPQILEILAQFGAKATFFMVGDNVRKNPGIFRAVTDQGHTVGNHTYHHLNGWHTAPGAYAYDVQRCREWVGSDLFRPPYGRFTPSQYMLLHKQYRFILWSVLTWDFHPGVSAGECLNMALEHTRSGSIVVFHDHRKTIEKVAYALPRFLEHLLSAGYTFNPL